MQRAALEVRVRDSIQHPEWPVRLIAGGRLIASAFVLFLYLQWAQRDLDRAFTLGIGAALFTLWSVAWLYLALRPKPIDMQWMLTATAIIDGIALALLSSSLLAYRTTLFGWYMVDATVFSILLRGKRSWPLDAILAISYVIGVVGGSGIGDVTDFVLMALNVGAILAVGIAVHLVLGKEEQHRAQIAAQAAEVVELNRRLERSVAELRAVTEITELIHSTLDIETVGPALLDILEKVIRIPAAALFVIDKTKQETVFSASNVGTGAIQRSYSGLELAGALRPSGSEGALSCIELADHNQMIVVFCADGEAIDQLKDDDRIVLGTVASELVVAVENSRLYRLTKRMAITDELTDLYNYRYLQQRLDDELGRAERYGKRLSLIMLDLDDFKRVNDTHGHLVGDSALSEVGQLLKNTVREVDVVARYGGEEFTVILPETDASGAFIVAEKIREAISMHRFVDADGARSVHLTASIGLSSYPAHSYDKESLLRSADDAVYHAKATGKDRVRAPRLKLRRLPADEVTEGISTEVAE